MWLCGSCMWLTSLLLLVQPPWPQTHRPPSRHRMPRPVFLRLPLLLALSLKHPLDLGSSLQRLLQIALAGSVASPGPCDCGQLLGSPQSLASIYVPICSHPLGHILAAGSVLFSTMQ